MKSEVQAILDIWDAGEWKHCSGDMAGAIIELRKAAQKPVAWRKNYGSSGYTYFDDRWPTVPSDAEPLYG